jgi:hypothetical protein
MNRSIGILIPYGTETRQEDMDITKVEGQTWVVFEGHRLLADVFLDYNYRIHVVLLQTHDPEQILGIKQLALWHAQSYGSRRDIDNHLPRVKWTASQLDSEQLLDFAHVSDEIRALSETDINNGLNEHRIFTAASRFNHAHEALYSLVAAVGENYDIRLNWSDVSSQKGATYGPAEIAIQFGTESTPFVFWRALSPDLEIVPPYHPMRRGGKLMAMINSTTNAFIDPRRIIIDVQPPDETRTTTTGLSSNYWKDLNHHPFFARGKSFRARLNQHMVRSQEGYALTRQLIVGALNLDNTYIGINGGFEPPFTRKRNPRVVRPRGSEHHAVWEYQVLREEGQLRNSVIPSWFMHEDWLACYDVQSV